MPRVIPSRNSGATCGCVNCRNAATRACASSGRLNKPRCSWRIECLPKRTRLQISMLKAPACCGGETQETTHHELLCIDRQLSRLDEWRAASDHAPVWGRSLSSRAGRARLSVLEKRLRLAPTAPCAYGDAASVLRSLTRAETSPFGVKDMKRLSGLYQVAL